MPDAPGKKPYIHTYITRDGQQYTHTHPTGHPVTAYVPWAAPDNPTADGKGELPNVEQGVEDLAEKFAEQYISDGTSAAATLLGNRRQGQPAYGAAAGVASFAGAGAPPSYGAATGVQSASYPKPQNDGRDGVAGESVNNSGFLPKFSGSSNGWDR